MTLIWSAALDLPQIPFGRLFRRLDRPVPEGAEIVTAYTDGQVTLRSNRAKIGYHEAADLSGFKGVKAGDFVVHGLDILRGSVGIADSAGAITAVCTVCEPVVDLEPRYVAHVIRVQARSGYTRALARGIREGGADFRRWGTLAELPIPMPPLEYQRAVCDYLGRETARIDTLIEEQQRLIELLRERRHAVLAHALLTGGRRVPFVRCMTEQVDYRGATPQKTDDGVQLVTARNVKPGWIDYEVSREFVDPADYAEVMHRGFPRIGDLLFTMEAPLANVAVVDREDIALAQRIIKWSVDRSIAEPRFLMYAALSDDFQGQLRARSTGSTALGIKASKLPELRIDLPPLGVQRQIIADLDEKTAKIDALIAESERFIDLSRERRASLITAAVTGQIDVRKMA